MTHTQGVAVCVCVMIHYGGPHFTLYGGSPRRMFAWEVLGEDP